jgi:plasmid stabilization system protein ParE
MIRASLSPKAECDLDEAFSHIAANNREAAVRVRNSI